jgi:hypothetical protein
MTLLLGCLLSCSSPSRKSDSDSKKSLSQKDRALLELAVNLQYQVAKETWPGFANFITSVAYFTNNGQFLLNPKGPVPDEYQLVSSTGPDWSREIYSTLEWRAQDGSKFTQQEIDTAYLANAFSDRQTNNHFSYSVFFLDSLDRFHLKNMKWDVDDWLAIFWHEVFHNFQDSLYKSELVTAEVTNYSHLKHYVESESFLKRIRAEQVVLSQALNSSNTKLKRRLICQKLIPMRVERYKSMPAQSVTAEQFYEISEGTARYVEELMSVSSGRLLDSSNIRSQFAVPGFLFFTKYAKRDRSHYFDSIQKDISPQNRYFYNTGFALSLLLDQVKPDWKTKAFSEKGFLFGQIRYWCEK